MTYHVGIVVSFLIIFSLQLRRKILELANKWQVTAHYWWPIPFKTNLMFNVYIDFIILIVQIIFIELNSIYYSDQWEVSTPRQWRWQPMRGGGSRSELKILVDSWQVKCWWQAGEFSPTRAVSRREGQERHQWAEVRHTAQHCSAGVNI